LETNERFIKLSNRLPFDKDIALEICGRDFKTDVSGGKPTLIA
jgi:hypothetical protein